MKKYLKKRTIGAISFCLMITAACLLYIGCSKECNLCRIYEPNHFKLVPFECSIIGEINVTKLSKLDTVKKQIEENKDTAFVKELENAGIGWNNIKSLCFAISPPIQMQGNTPSPNALILVEANNKIDIEKLIPIVEKEIKKKITSEKIGSQMVYLIPQDDNQQIFISKLKDNLVAIGTKSIIKKTIDLDNGKGKSIADNAKLMKLVDNAKQNNMFWVGCVIEKDLLKSLGIEASMAKAQDILIYADYSKDALAIGGSINCTSKQEAQKILAQAQMLTAMFIVNPDNGINNEDVSLTVDKSELNVKISIPKQTLEKLAEQQMQNLPVTATPQVKTKSGKKMKATTPESLPKPIKPEAIHHTKTSKH
jgi:hypothetical protein